MKKLITLSVLIIGLALNQNLYSQNNALHFDGTDDYVTTSQYIDLSFQSFAIEGWFMADAIPSAGNYPHIFGILAAGSDAAFVRINGDSEKLEFVMNSDAGFKVVSSVETIQTDIWYHAAILYHMGGVNDTQYLLINGEVVAYVTYTHVNNYSNRQFCIGGDGNRHFDGQVDDVKVWANIARSSADVRTSMYKQVVGNESNLIAYYKLDETSGTTADNAEGTVSYDGTLTNMTGNEWITSSAFFGPKNCLNFDGDDDNVWCSSITPTVTSGTIEFWVNLDVIPTDNARLISRHSEYGYDEIYLLNNDGRIYTAGSFVVGDDLQSTNPLPTDVWTHVAITADGSGSKLYINGILDDIGGAADFDYNTFRFGGQYTAGFYECIDGMMDEVRLWNDIRTETEIRENMFKTLIGDETNLVAYYNLDNRSGAIAQCYPTEGNDGSIGGSPAWVTSTAFNTWLNTDDSDWATTSNWSRNSIPSSTDNLSISNLTTNPQVDLTPSSPALANNLVINSGTTLTINSGKALTISGNLFNTGTLNIKADATGVGSLIHNTDAVSANVECYFEEDQWHMISAPISDAQSGIFSGSYLRYFSESDSTWTNITTLDYDLTAGQGYVAWNYNNQTVTYSGSLNNGEITPALTYSSGAAYIGIGWNLIGNPFPSYVDFDGTWATGSIDGTIYLYNGSQYVTWNGSTGTNNTGNISPGQAFWIHANTESPWIKIPQNKRIHSTQAFYKNEQTNELKLFVDGNGYSDQAIVVFNEKAKNSFDTQWDGYKLFGIDEAPQMYFDFNGTKYSVNNLPTSEQLSIPLDIETAFSNEYTISTNIGTFSTYGDVFLEDLLTGEMVDLRQTGSFSFESGPELNSNRFLLHFYGVNGVGQEEENHNSDIYSYENSLYIYSQYPTQGELQVFDLLGRQVYTETHRIEGQSKISLELPYGFYIVNFTSPEKVISNKILIK